MTTNRWHHPVPLGDARALHRDNRSGWYWLGAVIAVICAVVQAIMGQWLQVAACAVVAGCAGLYPYMRGAWYELGYTDGWLNRDHLDDPREADEV